MNGKWNTVRLRDVCQFENGDRGKNYPGRKAFVSKGIPFINAGHLMNPGIDMDNMNFIPRNRFDLIGSGKVRDGDLLFCLRGSLGKYAVVAGLKEGAIASSLVIVRPSSKLDKQFLSAYFGSSLCKDMINKYANGAAQPNLSAKSLGDFELPLPPLPEQKRIVAILDKAFAAIDEAVANTEKNLANARALFESYLNGMFEQEVREDISTHVWPKLTLSEVCTKIQDGAHRSPQVLYPVRGEGRYPYLTSKNIRTNFLKLDKLQYCDREFHNEIYARCNPEFGDVLLTKDGANTGNVTINTLDEPFSLLSSVCLLKPDRTKLMSRFLSYYIQSKEGFEQITGQMTGAAIKRIILKTIKASRIPLPSIPEQNKIVTHLDMLSTRTHHLESIYQQKLTALAELKQSILQKAFTGELTADSSKLEHVA